MSINKVKTILLAVAGGLALLGLVLFFVTPLLGGVNYSSLTVFGEGIKTLFALDFSYGVSLIFIGFSALCLFLIIWWVILLMLRKRYKDLIWIIGIVALDVVVLFVCAGFFLVPVDLGGAEPVKLFRGLMALENNLVAVIVSSISVLFLGVSIFVAALFMFFDITTTTLEMKPEVVKVEKVKVQVVKEPAETDDEYYERMIREMGMFHENEQEQ